RPMLFREGVSDSSLDPRGLSEALNHLPREAREIVVLKVWGRLTFEQIASVTGLSPATAHRRFQESLSELRSLLEPPCPKVIPTNTARA
ncbi:MAG: RNA polymerase sigma factor, partial [Phycisphaerales bacterium]